MRSSFVAIAAAFFLGNAVQAQTAEQFFNRALAAQQRGDLLAAIQYYDSVLKLRPHFVPALANLAFAELRVGRVDDAIANYRAALRQQPNSARLAVLTADALISVGRFPEAVQLLQPMEPAHANDLDLRFELGEALIDIGKLHEGLPLVERVAVARKDANAWMLVALTQLRLTQSKPAIASAETAAQLDPKLPGALTLEGIAKAYEGDITGAREAYRRALELNPKDFDANLWLGSLILRNDGDAHGAMPYLETAVQLNPGSLSAHFALAKAQVAERDDTAAISNLETIVQRNPNLIEPHVQLAALYGRAKRKEDAERERAIVDRLNAEQAKAGPSAATSLEPALPGVTAAPSPQ